MNGFSTASPYVSFLDGRIRPFDGKTRNNRGWRLLAFLLWQHHVDQVDQAPLPTQTPRARLKRYIGVEPRPPISDLKEYLRRVSATALLTDDDSGLALRDCHLLPCDLAELLHAMRRGDRARAREIIPNQEAVAKLARNIARVKGDGTLPLDVQSWISAMIEKIEAFVGNAVREEVDEQTRRYLEAHRDRCGHIDLRDLSSPVDGVDARLPLEDVYVSLVVGPRGVAEIVSDRRVTGSEDDHLAPPLDLDAPASSELLVHAQPDGQSTIHFTNLIREDRWCIVLGEPGAGKTTLLHWLAHFNARVLLTPDEDHVVVRGARFGLDDVSIDLGPARIPVLVRIGEWAPRGADPTTLPELEDFIGQHTVREQPLPDDPATTAAVIRAALADERALVLLDGLDEVDNEELRAAVVRRVERFVDNYVADPTHPTAHRAQEEDDGWADFTPPLRGGNQIVVTSRVHGYKQAPLAGPFQLVRARRLDPVVAERFAQQWFLALENARPGSPETPKEEAAGRAAAQSDLLIAAMRSNPCVQDLARNPLLITVLAAVQAQTGDALPTTRVALYARAVRVLTKRRMNAWTFEQIVGAVGPFALWLQANRPRGIAYQAELEECLAEGIARLEPNDPEELLAAFFEAAERQSGLLVQYATNIYGFPHASFREYLAAVEIARQDISKICEWLDEYLRDARWTEVVLLVLATLSTTRPEDADAALRHVLSTRSPLEELLHHDLLIAGQALAEMEGADAHVEPVIMALLQAAQECHERSVPVVERRVLETVRRLVDMRGADVEDVLVDALADRGLARVAALALASSTVASLDRLEALDLAARRPAAAHVAGEARKTVALTLIERGEDLPADCHPLGDLWAEGAELASAYARIAADAPRLHAALLGFADDVKPGIYGLVRSVLSAANAPAAVNEGRVIADLVAACRDLLDDHGVIGVDFIDIAHLAFALDAPGTRAWLAQRVAAVGVDVESAAAFYDRVPMALLDEGDVAGWLDGLNDEDAVVALLALGNRQLRNELVRLAWRQLGQPLSPRTRRAATCTLVSEAFATGRLVATDDALTSLLRLLDGLKEERTLATVLFACLRLDGRQFGGTVIELLESLTQSEDEVLARSAAVLVASDPSTPLTAHQYDLIAVAIAANGELRPLASGVLAMRREADVVTDDVLARAAHHTAERVAAGDHPAGVSHSSFTAYVGYEDAARLVEHLDTGQPWWPGQPSVAASEAILRWVVSAPEDAADLAIGAVGWAAPEFRALGLDLESLVRECLARPDGPARVSLAQLISCEATLRGELELLRDFLMQLAEIDGPAVASAVLDAAYVLPGSRMSASAVAEVAEVAFARANEHNAVPGWMMAGAHLALDVQRYDVDQVLRDLRNRAAVGWSRALVYALNTAMWSPPSYGSEAALSDAQNLVPRRLGLVAARAGRQRTGLEQLVRAADTALGDELWTRRRAVLFALDAAAGANPGHFLREARGAGLRSKIMVAADDFETGITGRRIAISLLARFRQLDQALVTVVLMAARDEALVSEVLLDRYEAFDSVGEFDIGVLLTELGSRNVQAILAAATLLTTAARTARFDAAGRTFRRTVVDALVAAAATDDPLLDSARARRAGGTAREALHEMIAILVWDPPTRRTLETVIARVAFSRSWEATSDAADADVTIREYTPVDAAVRLVAESNWVAEPTPDLPQQLNDRAWPDELGQLTEAQDKLLRTAVYKMLEFRVGARLAMLMTTSQLDEFEGYFEIGDDAGAHAFLTQHFPHHRDIVNAEARRLLIEAAGEAPALRPTLAELAGPDAVADLFEHAFSAEAENVERGGDTDEIVKLATALAEQDVERALSRLEAVYAGLETTGTAAHSAALLRGHAVVLLRSAAAAAFQNRDLAQAERYLQRALGVLASMPGDHESDAVVAVWRDLGAISHTADDIGRAVERLVHAHTAATAQQGSESRIAVEVGSRLASLVAYYDIDAALALMPRLAASEPAASPWLQPEARAHQRATVLRVGIDRYFQQGTPWPEPHDPDQELTEPQRLLSQRIDALVERLRAEVGPSAPMDVGHHRRTWTLGMAALARQEHDEALRLLRLAAAGMHLELGAANQETVTALVYVAHLRSATDPEAALADIEALAAELAGRPRAALLHERVLRTLVRATAARACDAETPVARDSLDQRALTIAREHTDVGDLKPSTLRREIAAVFARNGRRADAIEVLLDAIADRITVTGTYDDDDVKYSLTEVLDLEASDDVADALARVDALRSSAPALAEWLDGERERLTSATP